MQSRKVDNTYILRLDKGDEIIPTLQEFCKQNNISAGIVSGLGVANEVKLGCFDGKNKSYETIQIKEDCEITSLTGNISYLNNEAFVHLHINLADGEFNVCGGHLLAGKIGLTGEIFIQALNTKIDRIKDEKIGLNVFNL